MIAARVDCALCGVGVQVSIYIVYGYRTQNGAKRLLSLLNPLILNKNETTERKEERICLSAATTDQRSTGAVVRLAETE